MDQISRIEENEKSKQLGNDPSAKIAGREMTLKKDSFLGRFGINFEFGYEGSLGKEMDPDSKTLPDCHLTVRQMLDRWTRGQTTDVKQYEPVFFDTIIPVIRDMTDVQAYREHLEREKERTDEWIEAEKAKALEQLEKKAETPVNPSAEKTAAVGDGPAEAPVANDNGLPEGAEELA